VTHAALSNWEYYEIIRRAANQTCSSALQHSIEKIDDILSEGKDAKALKAIFGLDKLEHDDDFTAILKVDIFFGS
jgi:hypothetical protein